MASVMVKRPLRPLREVAATRNIRSILFQFSRSTARDVFWSPEVTQVCCLARVFMVHVDVAYMLVRV